MSLTDTHREIIDAFRTWFEEQLAGDERLGRPTRHDRQDGSTLATRWEVAPNLWYELTLRPLIPQARAGVLTDDRWKSEELEQKIEDSGDTMSEFVEAGFDAVELEWPDPVVEHYRDQGRYFYFATALELESPDALGEPATRDKILKMLRGYIYAFTGEAS
jgi:hypothetical protein